MWWMDTLNLQALSIYPLAFQAKKTSSRPLLYYYTLSAAVLCGLPSGSGRPDHGLGGPWPTIAAGNSAGLAAGLTDLQGSFNA